MEYQAYIEIGVDGFSMAHVLDLPGCFARADDFQQVFPKLKHAIQETIFWMVVHGEAQHLQEEPVNLSIAEVQKGHGPFNPGDDAALFTPERKYITKAEMETYFRWMGFARQDLLRLVYGLTVEQLDWKPDLDSFTPRKILRHIGNAEQWYVSRLVPRDELPAEWDDDENLDLMAFLEMERRTALDCLRKLTDKQRGDIFYPTAWTRNPDEPWSARKVLRRFLEHEREHTVQIGDILDAYHEAQNTG
jgi:predicted RNase H-like HicB family nuclease/uncharacterized damage-inducible protein DinB